MPLTVLLCTALLLASCSETDPATQSFSVVLNAQLPEGKPLTGVRFWANGRELGVSGDDGTLASSIAGHEGDSVSVAAICPSGYRGSSQPRALSLRAFAPAIPDKRATLALTFPCEREERLAALVVRSRLSDRPLRLPVHIDGENSGETDEHGTAHFLVRVAQSAKVRVMLDTASLPDAVPTNPVRSFDVDESESILLFDQRFEQARAQHRARGSIKPRRTHVPYRIQ